jgi:ferredoxin-thioredoxin reductase catalytic subunit
MAKQIRISFRTTADFKRRAQQAAEKVNLDESVIEAAAIEAVVAHIEKYGEITIPVKIARTGDDDEKKFASPSTPPALPARERSSSSTVLHGPNEPESEYKPRRRRSV